MVYLSSHDDKQPKLNLGDRGEDIAYPHTLIELLLRMPSKYGVGTDGSQQILTANFTCSSIRKLNTTLTGSFAMDLKLYNSNSRNVSDLN